MLLEPARDEDPSGLEEVEHAVVRGPVEDARPLPAGLDDADPAKRGQVLRRRPLLQPEIRLQRADRLLALPQELDDPDAGGMPENTEQAGLHLVHGTDVVRHGRTLA